MFVDVGVMDLMCLGPALFYARSAILCHLLKMAIFRQPGSAIDARAAAIFTSFDEICLNRYHFHLSFNVLVASLKIQQNIYGLKGLFGLISRQDSYESLKSVE